MAIHVQRIGLPAPGRVAMGWLLGVWLLVGNTALRAAEPIDEARDAYRKGEYAKCLSMAGAAVAARDKEGDWPLLQLRVLLTLGRQADAYDAATNALARDSRSIRLRWLAREVFTGTGRTNEARAMIDEIRALMTNRPWAYREAADLVAFGKVALVLGADPKDVLERLYDPALKADPKSVEAHLAKGELALDKHDGALAAKAFEAAVEAVPQQPDLMLGLARAYADSDRVRMMALIDEVLKINPRHLPTLLILADHQIDAENYDGATKLLDEVKAVNPVHPDHWAYRAVLAHLRYDAAGEAAARQAGLAGWERNPRMDHLIGLKLSQKYRFAEGAASQRRALSMDPGYLPAKAQLASDLLRLGEETEGWQLAQDVHGQDGYDVAAYNLVTLHDTMSKFTTISNAAFVVRMNAREAEIYGSQVMDLLGRASAALVSKYGATLQLPTFVEIFANQKDFGVRTFGMPDNPGFLGVCFGRVVTANSPAANPGHPVNWQAVLWHEFCHVVTLQLTANRMPRWLSEGISVHEERQANPAWGQRMTPRYREMILKGDMPPVARLSGAFLAPRTPFHLQFAYFHSSLVVDFLVREFGVEKLRGILGSLREGVDINAAIARHTVAMDEFEKRFTAFARASALAMAPGLDFDRPETNLVVALGAAGLESWAEGRPTNYWALVRRAGKLTADRQWAEARPVLEKLVELHPTQQGSDSAFPMLAAVYRHLGETNREREVLSRHAAQDADAVDAYLRLAEMNAASGQWTNVLINVDRYLAVNPLTAMPYRWQARASEGTGRIPGAIEAQRTLLKLDPPNPSEVHFDLARLLESSDPTLARRHVLAALEEVPRHRAALRLLRRLQEKLPAHARSGSSNGKGFE